MHPDYDDAGSTVRLGVQEKSFTTLNTDNAAVVGPTLLGERELPLGRALLHAGASFAARMVLGYSDAGFESSHDLVADLQERVSRLRRRVNDTEARITVAEERSESFPDHLRGWPLGIVTMLVAISIFFEYVPAALYVQAFAAARDGERMLLAVIFTVIGSQLALFLGEILRRLREPIVQRARERVFVVLVGLMITVFILLGYELRIAASTRGLTDNQHSIEALALATISAIGVAIIAISSYYREGFQYFLVRRTLNRLRRSLVNGQRRLDSATLDLHRLWGSDRP